MNGDESVGLLSPLAVDLALARACLAALKLQGGQQIDDDEKQSVELLRDYYQTERDFAADSSTLSEDTVPQDSMRHGLEETLATFSPTVATAENESSLFSGRLIQLLDRLADQGTLSPEEAAELVTALNQIEVQDDYEKEFPRLNGIVK